MNVFSCLTAVEIDYSPVREYRHRALHLVPLEGSGGACHPPKQPQCTLPFAVTEVSLHAFDYAVVSVKYSELEIGYIYKFKVDK